ncbi:MAG: DUF1688 family protein [Burkholderiaceae bacterium]
MRTVFAHDILVRLLDTLSGIWPSKNAIERRALGDCWRHPQRRARG